MIVDLYNNHKTYIEEQRQDWDIARWLRQHGVTLQDLDTHPQITDIVLLINIRQQLWHSMTASEQATWGAYWSVVYTRRLPLNNKAFRKFELITQLNQLRHATIKSLRIGSAKQNIGQDNKAKGPCLPQVTNTKREPQECREVPTCVHHTDCDAHLLWW